MIPIGKMDLWSFQTSHFSDPVASQGYGAIPFTLEGRILGREWRCVLSRQRSIRTAEKQDEHASVVATSIVDSSW